MDEHRRHWWWPACRYCRRPWPCNAALYRRDKATYADGPRRPYAGQLWYTGERDASIPGRHRR